MTTKKYLLLWFLTTLLVSFALMIAALKFFAADELIVAKIGLMLTPLNAVNWVFMFYMYVKSED